ncbi:MAG: RNA pyrophosphohydrolase [Pseudomonadota bacterium]
MSPADLPYRPCVGIVLANPAGLIFLGERKGHPGAWQMPQGGIDEGEAPRDAALRELQEETGIQPQAVEILAEHPDWLSYDLPPEIRGGAFRGRYRGQTQRWFLLRYSGRDGDISLDQTEFAAWRWADSDTAIDAIVGFKRPIYREVFSHFSQFLGS